MAAPVNTVAPALSGTFEQGQTVYCDSGTWTGLTAQYTYTYQWQRNTGSGFVNIAGTDASDDSDYVLGVSDVGVPVRCVVTATNLDGATAANSNSRTPTIPSDALVRVAGAWHGSDQRVRVGSAWV